MKRIVTLTFTIAIIIVIVWVGKFWYDNLRGVGPAVRSPIGDITKSISGLPEPAENSTDFPLKLPAGFSISIFAKGLGNPRVMKGDMYGNYLVSIPSRGQVVALSTYRDNKTIETISLLDHLNKPHGLELVCTNMDGYTHPTDPCYLYIAEMDKVVRYEYFSKGVRARVGEGKKIMDLPSGGNHTTRSLLVTPDGKRLLVSVGSSCNVCHEKNEQRAAVLSVNLDGSDKKIFATGLRNAVFMTTKSVNNAHLPDDEIWVTEMGRDLIGDDIPPDEINILKEGRFYGWPNCYGKNIVDTTFDASEISKSRCVSAESSNVDFQAHSAPLGLAFINKNTYFPRDYWYNLLVAFHGSWNRSEPTGYKIVRVKFDEKGNYLGMEDFITGWLTKGGVLGRPVDILMTSVNSFLISDDKAGVIYKVKYKSSK